MAETLSIHEKLMDIQQRLKVPKDKVNEYSKSKFLYRNLEGIEEAVKPFLKEHKLSLTFSDEMMGVGNRTYLKATASLSDGEKIIEVSAFAQHAEQKTGMDEAQLTGACSSYARKYAVGGLFLIDETKDLDEMDNSKQTKKSKWQPSTSRSISDDQRMMIENLLRKKGIEGKDTISEYMFDNFGALPTNELEAYEVINDLDAKEVKDE